MKCFQQYNDGIITIAELYSQAIENCDTQENIDLIITMMPEEFRTEFINYLRTMFSVNPQNWFRIMGGIYSWEVEADPVKREQMRQNHLNEEKTWVIRHETVITPNVRNWLKQHDRSK